MCLQVFICVFSFLSGAATVILTSLFLRGNHENSRMNEKYNFSDQCADRYRRPLYDDVMTLFTLLPLSAVVGMCC